MTELDDPLFEPDSVMICPKCESVLGSSTCPNCDGTGHILKQTHRGTEYSLTCFECFGSGLFWDCPNCEYGV